MDNKKVAGELIKLAKEIVGLDIIEQVSNMSINELGRYIARKWKNVNYSAKSYLEAMQKIDSQGNYLLDDWQSVVAYFLANATSWKGEEAREVKKELNRRLKTKKMNG